MMNVTRPQKRRRKNTKVELATQKDEAFDTEETAKTDKDPELQNHQNVAKEKIKS